MYTRDCAAGATGCSSALIPLALTFSCVLGLLLVSGDRGLFFFSLSFRSLKSIAKLARSLYTYRKQQPASWWHDASEHSSIDL